MPPVCFSRKNENSSKSVVVASIFPYYCSTRDFNSSISGVVIFYKCFLFLLLNNVFKLAPASVVLIELLLACRYVKHAGREERSTLGGEGIRIAYGWIGGIDVEVGERTAIEDII